MKKISIVLILVAVVALSLWYFFFSNTNIPIGETVRNSMPFGSGNNAERKASDLFTSSNSNQNKSPNADKLGNPDANLFRISGEPVAGAVILSQVSSTTIVRYVDRATGHIYDVNLATLAKTKITNQTLPKIYEAYFRADGNAVLLRSLKDNSDMVENLTIILTAPKTISADTLYSASSTILRQDMGAVTIGSGDTLYYTLRDNSSIVISTFKGTGLKTLLNSPFKDWRLASADNNLITYTKASAGAAGYAYTLNTKGGGLTKILGPLYGLVVIPNISNNRILYSYVETNKTKLFAKNLKTNTFSEVQPATLAEKCVWSIKNIDLLICAVPADSIETGEPDRWYRGLTHFSDRIWVFDTKLNIAQVVVEPKPSLDIDLDAIDLKLSSDESYLVFTNKTDLSLWALRLVNSI